MEDGFWEALKALGEPTVGVDGFMVHIDGSHQSVTNIFEYSNILVTNIYSDIRS